MVVVVVKVRQSAVECSASAIFSRVEFWQVNVELCQVETGEENEHRHLFDPTFTAGNKCRQMQKTVHKTAVVLFLMFLRIIVCCGL